MENKTKLLIGLGVVALGTGGYFLYKHLTKNEQKKSFDDFTQDIKNNILPDATVPVLPKPKSPSGYKPKPATTKFPLVYGSKGNLVKQVQQALMKKYPGVLPRYKDDSYYGKELQQTLLEKQISTVIDSELYDKILSGKAGVSPKEKSEKPDNKQDKKPELGHESIADLMYSGVVQANIDTCLRALWQIGSVQEYIKVNEVFKTKRIGGVRKTIATALSHAFMFDPNRKKYRAQLYRIGLKWRNDQWALAGPGLFTNELVTIRKAKIWDSKGYYLIVPTGTIIGSFVMAKNGLTQFRTIDNRNLFVETTALKYRHD